MGGGEGNTAHLSLVSGAWSISGGGAGYSPCPSPNRTRSGVSHPGQDQDKGSCLSAWTGPGRGYLTCPRPHLPPQIGHAMDRIRRWRYASCSDIRGFSSFDVFMNVHVLTKKAPYPSNAVILLFATSKVSVFRFEEPEEDALNQALDDDITSLVLPERQLSIPVDAESGRITFGDEDNMNTSLDFMDEGEGQTQEVKDNMGVARLIDRLQNNLLHVSIVYI